MARRPLAEVAPRFVEMAHGIGIAIAASRGADGRPHTRPMQPVWTWDGTDLVGWASTATDSPKVADLRHVPSLSVTYWEPGQDTCTADCDVELVDDDDTRRWAWELFAATPPPAGFDPAIHPDWDDATSPTFGVLRLRPTWLRVMPGTLMTAGEGEVITWAAKDAPPRDGSQRLLFRNTMRIYDGHLDEYRAAIEDAVAFAEAHAPQVMVDVFIDEASMRAYSFQLYDDSAAVRRHWELSDPYIQRVMEHCDVEHFEAYGAPDDVVRARLGTAGGEAEVIPRLTGFLRRG